LYLHYSPLTELYSQVPKAQRILVSLASPASPASYFLVVEGLLM
jgi:hypothetical protein